MYIFFTVTRGRAMTCRNQQQRWSPVPDAIGRGGQVDKSPSGASCSVQQKHETLYQSLVPWKMTCQQYSDAR